MRAFLRGRTVARRLVICIGIVVITLPAFAEWNEKVLYSFQGGNDGAVPAGGVVFDEAGNLYGATSDGGSGCTGGGSCGTVFQLVPPANKGGEWKENILYMFHGTDGQSPEGGVILDAKENLYGTTAYGGRGNCKLFGSTVGCGVVYEMIRPAQPKGAWKEKILYNFQGDEDGQFPIGDLVFDQAGNLYGATQFGGGYGSCDSPYYQHCGTIFELIPPSKEGERWTEKMLYSFKSVETGKQYGDGANPNGGLIFDINGAIYGTTYSGGNQTCSGAGFVGCGTVFKLSPPIMKGGPWKESLLYRFGSYANDGELPTASMVFDRKWNLYGTTTGGGERFEGVLFRLVSAHQEGQPWIETLLHQFGLDDGGAALPGGLIFSSGGELYGVARGGRLPGGLVFRLAREEDADWTYTMLYNLAGPPDGKWPQASLFLNGKELYGTTLEGGTGQSCQLGCGTVFLVEP